LRWSVPLFGLGVAIGRSWRLDLTLKIHLPSHATDGLLWHPRATFLQLSQRTRALLFLLYGVLAGLASAAHQVSAVAIVNWMVQPA